MDVLLLKVNDRREREKRKRVSQQVENTHNNQGLNKGASFSLRRKIGPARLNMIDLDITENRQ